MISPIDDQWDFINPPNTMSSTNEPQTTIPATEPKIEVTINTKPAPPSDNKKERAEPIRPKLERKDTAESVTSDDSDISRHPRPVRRGGRRYSPSPIRRFPRIPQPPPPISPHLSSSMQLLENVDYDGIAELPYPARSNVYLTTYPFTERDVKKWAWLFAHGVEDVFLTDGVTRDDEDDESEDDWFPSRGRRVRPVRNRNRNCSPYWDQNFDIPSVYLSRALDKEVVPEDSEQNVKYLVVVQNRSNPSGGVKLLTAESRKAAGIVMYHEALMGNSIVFVGAIAGPTGKKMKKKFKKVDSVEAAREAAEDGVVGIIC